MSKTISVQMFRALVAVLSEEEGLENINLLLKESGISHDLLSDPNYRINPDDAGLFWEKTNVKEQGDYFGLKLGLGINLHELGVSGMFFLYSTTIKEALNKQVKYNRLISDFIQIELVKRENKNIENIVFGYPVGHPKPLYVMQVQVLIYMRAILKRTNGGCYPERVWFNFPHPGEEIYLFENIIKCPIIFDEGVTSIEYKSDKLNFKIPSENSQILSHVESLAVDNIRKLSTNKSLCLLIYDLIKQSIYAYNKVLTVKEIADQLNVSIRTLQRNLKAELSSYSIILDEVRKNESIKLLEKEMLNVNEIAWFLGYSEPSTFIKKFKIWTTVSPFKYKLSKLKGTSDMSKTG